MKSQNKEKGREWPIFEKVHFTYLIEKRSIFTPNFYTESFPKEIFNETKKVPPRYVIEIRHSAFFSVPLLTNTMTPIFCRRLIETTSGFRN